MESNLLYTIPRSRQTFRNVQYQHIARYRQSAVAASIFMPRPPAELELQTNFNAIFKNVKNLKIGPVVPKLCKIHEITLLKITKCRYCTIPALCYFRFPCKVPVLYNTGTLSFPVNYAFDSNSLTKLS